MSQRSLIIIFFLFLLLKIPSEAQTHTENVVLITLDGMRWQEVFQGANEDIISSRKYVKDRKQTKDLFWDKDPALRRAKLMPFIWSTVVSEGQMYGNRRLGNRVDLANRYWFSYPGYNELLTGITDRRINSNARINNPNTTILEFVNQKKAYQNKVAVFASWDVFHYIINGQRSGVHINAGNDTAGAQRLSARETYLNHLQKTSPSPWGSVRYDEFTHQYAREYFKKNSPRLMLIAYGETDEYAHQGDYEGYLRSARKTDDYIREVWDWIQSDSCYRNKTTMIITTDHGRGKGRNTWKSHGIARKGSNHTWFMVMGPDTLPLGEMEENKRYFSQQLAKTIAALLNLSYPVGGKQGEAVATVFEQ